MGRSECHSIWERVYEERDRWEGEIYYKIQWIGDCLPWYFFVKAHQEEKHFFDCPSIWYPFSLLSLLSLCSFPSFFPLLQNFPLRVEHEVFLFDCGESCQNRMLSSDFISSSITKIFITHLHGDHVKKQNKNISSLSFIQRSFRILIYSSKF